MFFGSLLTVLCLCFAQYTRVNVDVTSPAATVALGLMFLKSNKTSVSREEKGRGEEEKRREGEKEED